MKVVRINPQFAVADQVALEDIPAIAEAGFTVLVNNRPDNEVPGQPSHQALAEAAAAQGLTYRHYPVTAQTFPGPDPESLAEVFDPGEGATLAFCRSGTRSVNLWLSSRDPAVLADEAEQVRRLGYDLSMLALALQRRG
ncbi:protein tyrosine phosphatase family protein [Haliea atlantica]|nr:TIGR01244 family phosphatase [Haliea sp.]MAL95745.1 TIGR01244 family phosphatase [Haliea sp.]|tara:strand:- start:4019 stop:4435 length:417 start_codon:yes stop_codon:yes gene_type:complete